VQEAVMDKTTKNEPALLINEILILLKNTRDHYHSLKESTETSFTAYESKRAQQVYVWLGRMIDIHIIFSRNISAGKVNKKIITIFEEKMRDIEENAALIDHLDEKIVDLFKQLRQHINQSS
jgi:hypothetical protein